MASTINTEVSEPLISRKNISRMLGVPLKEVDARLKANGAQAILVDETPMYSLKTRGTRATIGGEALRANNLLDHVGGMTTLWEVSNATGRPTAELADILGQRGVAELPYVVTRHESPLYPKQAVIDALVASHIDTTRLPGGRPAAPIVEAPATEVLAAADDAAEVADDAAEVAPKTVTEPVQVVRAAEEALEPGTELEPFAPRSVRNSVAMQDLPQLAESLGGDTRLGGAARTVERKMDIATIGAHTLRNWKPVLAAAAVPAAVVAATSPFNDNFAVAIPVAGVAGGTALFAGKVLTHLKRPVERPGVIGLYALSAVAGGAALLLPFWNTGGDK
jgi:hypothetical protein